MKLSIIIPSRNSSASILKTVKSAYDSDSKLKFEILLIDDFSNDDSVKLVRKNFQRVKICKLDVQKGVSAARNLGIKKSKNALLLFIDSDVRLNKLAVDELIRNSLDHDIVFPNIKYENGRTMYPISGIEKSYPHISACFLIKKKCVKKIG